MNNFQYRVYTNFYTICHKIQVKIKWYKMIYLSNICTVELKKKNNKLRLYIFKRDIL